jgi:hypothetical protein
MSEILLTLMLEIVIISESPKQAANKNEKAKLFVDMTN